MKFLSNWFLEVFVQEKPSLKLHFFETYYRNVKTYKKYPSNIKNAKKTFKYIVLY